MKLKVTDIQVGKSKAEQYVLSLCKSLKYPVTHRKELNKTIEINNGIKVIKINLEKEVEFVRHNGKANMLQFMFDTNDIFLNTPLNIGIKNDGVEGIKVKIESNFGDHSSSIKGEGYIESPETSLVDDILYYREEVIKAYNESDFKKFSRGYRSYLQSCISLVDWFLYRYTFFVKNKIPLSEKAYGNIAILDSRRSIEDRLEAWMTTFAVNNKEEFKQSKYRAKFFDLKGQRNKIVHPESPTIEYEVRNIVKYLNYVQDGIGGLFAELRRYTGYSENIGFIRQIQSQGKIEIITNK
ncbi:MAG: hypothetical protein GY830_07725 [Bacteroidetes bacterium]|nr:hypothetical protein [Bacteroidota bacterium]